MLTFVWARQIKLSCWLVQYQNVVIDFPFAKVRLFMDYAKNHI